MTLTAERSGAAPSSGGATPARPEGLALLGAMQGSGHRAPPSLVRRADGQTIQLTPLLYLVLEHVDGHRTVAEIADEVSAAYGRRVDAQGVQHLIDSKLRPLGLVLRPDGSTPDLQRSNPLLALRFRYVVTDPDVTRRITAPFSWLFHPLVILPVIVAFVAIAVWLLGERGLAGATHEAFRTPGLLLTVFVLTVVSAGFHEFGHAAAARYGGATPGAMGAGLYLVWPAFYTDVTDSYRLGRAGRLRTDLGGLYFNAIVAVAVVGAWFATGWDALLLIVVTQILQMVRQLTPIVRFDGYHVLADTVGVPDLYQHIKPTLLGLLPTRWGDPATKVLRPWARAVIALWAIIVIPLLLCSFALMVLAMPRLAATAASSLADRWQQLTQADLLGAVAHGLAMIAIALPLAGMVYLVVRVVRRLVRRTLQATADRPARRTAAAVAAGVLVAALAWMWWPGNGDYRAVQAYERGTLGDVVAGVAGVADDRAAVVEGRAGRGTAVWPAAASGETPTRDEPVLAVVLVPADPASDAPTWVFPFDRPLPPGPGDNQAMAVNTTDGTVVYDVAFALVWLDGDRITNSNEAYAFASCTDCAAVAVGFQVVLAIGQVDVAVPENVAAAVNYACVRCVTYALASQLVVTLPDGLSAEAMADLNALWEEIRRFGESIEGVPLAELQDRLRDYEARILEIVERDATGAEVVTEEEAVVTATTIAASADDEPVAATNPAPADDEADQPATTTTLRPDPTTTAGSATADEPTATSVDEPTTSSTP